MYCSYIIIMEEWSCRSDWEWSYIIIPNLICVSAGIISYSNKEGTLYKKLLLSIRPHSGHHDQNKAKGIAGQALERKHFYNWC